MTHESTNSGVKTLLHLAWPVILARSSQSVINICDAAMIAPLGEDALAATTTGAVNVHAVAFLPIGLIFIVQSFASQLHGKGDLAGARRYGWYGLLVAVLIGVIGVGFAPFTGDMLGVFPYKDNVHGLMTEYIALRLFAIGPLVAMEALGNWYSGLGNTRIHMIASLITMVLNIFLNWVFIYGNLGAPALGVKGAALASTLATWVGFSFVLVLFIRQWGTERVADRGPLRRSEFWRMIRFGLPSGINWFLEFAAFTLFLNVVVADLGPVAQAAIMVVININSVSFMPAFGLASAGAILSGQAIGRDDRDAVPRITWTTMKLMLLWQGAIGITYVLFPELYMSLFDTPAENAEQFRDISITLLIISAAWQLFDAIAILLGEILRAAGDTTWIMWVRLSIAWFAFTPGAYLVVTVLDGGPTTAILCIVGYIALLAIALFWRFYISRAWRDIDLTGESDLPV